MTSQLYYSSASALASQGYAKTIPSSPSPLRISFTPDQSLDDDFNQTSLSSNTKYAPMRSTLLEAPRMERVAPNLGTYSFISLDTPEDRSDPISQYIDGLRAMGILRASYSQTSEDANEVEDIFSPDCDCEHCDGGSGYFATWEGDEDEDDDLDEVLSSSSFLLDHERFGENDDGFRTPSASSYTPVPSNTPSSSGASTRALGSFSAPNDSSAPAPGAPRLEAAPFSLPFQLPTLPGQDVQSRFEEILEQNEWVVNNGVDSISSYSSSSDSCPSTPPLSDNDD